MVVEVEVKVEVEVEVSSKKFWTIIRTLVFNKSRSKSCVKPLLV